MIVVDIKVKKFFPKTVNVPYKRRKYIKVAKLIIDI